MFTYSQIKAKATIVRRGMPSFSIRDAIEIATLALESEARQREREAEFDEEARLEGKYGASVNRYYA